MKTIFSAVIVLLFVSCKGNTDAPIKTAPSHQKAKKTVHSDKDLNQTETSSKVTFNEARYSDVYDAYLNVKAALVNTNAAIAQREAIALSQKVQGINEFSDDTRRAIKIIITEGDTKKQRVAFESVSKDLELILSANISTGTIYKQYCPMAFDGKGAYWLSDSKEVRNPYFGDQMLKCGVIDSKLGNSN